MRYLNVVLTLLVFILAVIATRLWAMSVAADNLSKSTMFLINAQQASVAAQDRLSEDVKALKDQIKEVSGRISVR